MGFISKEFAASLVAAQKATKTALKDAENPHFKKNYADLSSVVAACKEALNANGIAFVQRLGLVTVEGPGGTVEVTTTLVHESGDTLSDSFRIGLKDPYDPQKIGSAITYARRYGLSAICGVIADDDDDGNAASSPGAARTTAAPARPRELTKEASDAISRAEKLLALCEAGTATDAQAEECKNLIRSVSKDETRVLHPNWKRIHETAVRLFKKE